MLRFASTTFYDQFGITPDEIGLTYIDVLSRAAVLLSVAIGFVVIVSFVALVLSPLYRWLPKYKREKERYGEDWFEIQVGSVVLGVIIVFIVLVAVLSNDQAHSAALAVKQGRAAHATAWQANFEAEPVGLGWTGQAPDGMGDLPSHRLILLGQSAGQTFIYDADAAQTVRVPSELITLSFAAR